MVVRVSFRVANHHHLSTPWHLNFINAKTPEEAMSAAKSYLSRQDPNGIYNYDLQMVAA
ncbi:MULTISPECIES: hypothetical protein [Rhizobium]|jgi:hypothetical protein|uniref:Uncharacterized protein n=1 Tax=Rhizobium leguminosarum TaxID=384 RepID=A0A2K9Z4D3_RHILE|nr:MULTISPECIES: hypothetical protein [Rhizobium]AUW43105.1 hypothetical protein CUJ84_Chr002756 [Rhizobium leguminosarum]MBY3043284.1 hypothetical protein [Rhizobium leguminosarum]QJX05741.1 hypothetical protein RLCC275e_12570 [Rhizobium brockwellii]